MPEDDHIERCALVADEMEAQLQAQKPRARQGQGGRQQSLQIDYAIRAVRRVAERIRALKEIAPENQSLQDGNKLAAAREIAKELRPMVAQMGSSAFKRDMLIRLDELMRL